FFARMIFSYRFVWAAAAAAVLFAPAGRAASRAKSTHATAAEGAPYKAAIVVDAATGNVLFEDHADIAGPPASMTKLMTFAVLADKLAGGALTLQTPVTVT